MEAPEKIAKKLVQLEAEKRSLSTEQFIELATEALLEEDPKYNNRLLVAQVYITTPEILLQIFAYIGNNKALLALRKSNTLFQAIIDEDSITREQLRQYILTNRTKLSELQKSYLNSTRIQTKIKNGTFTLADIIKDIQTIAAFERDRDSTVHFSTSLASCFPYYSESLASYNSSDVQVKTISLFTDIIIKQGFLPTEGISPLYSKVHFDAVKQGVPFEEIQGLSVYQVQALLETALKISTPTDDPGVHIISLQLTHTRTEVQNRPLSSLHITALKTRHFPFKTIVNLNSLQITGLLAGFSETEVRNPHFSLLHLHAITLAGSLYKKEKILNLNSTQLRLFIGGGISYESALKLPTTLSDLHVNLICQGQYQLDAIKDLTESQLSLLESGKYNIQEIKEANFYPNVTDELLKRGYPLSNLKNLNKAKQKILLSNPHITVEQIKELAPAQLAVFKFDQEEKLTFEEVKKLPTSLHCLALQVLPYKTVIHLNAEDLLTKLQQKIDTSALYPSSEGKTEIPPSSPTLMFSLKGEEANNTTTATHNKLLQEPNANTTEQTIEKGFGTQEELKAALEAFQEQEKEKFNQEKPKHK